MEILEPPFGIGPQASELEVDARARLDQACALLPDAMVRSFKLLNLDYYLVTDDSGFSFSDLDNNIAIISDIPFGESAYSKFEQELKFYINYKMSKDRKLKFRRKKTKIHRQTSKSRSFSALMEVSSPRTYCSELLFSDDERSIMCVRRSSARGRRGGIRATSSEVRLPRGVLRCRSFTSLVPLLPSASR